MRWNGGRLVIWCSNILITLNSSIGTFFLHHHGYISEKEEQSEVPNFSHLRTLRWTTLCQVIGFREGSCVSRLKVSQAAVGILVFLQFRLPDNVKVFGVG